ncbi:MAG: molybdopterin-binding protein [Aminobacteriaceae bacterium]|jgi:molybdopterin biosynthesis enzyme MoaB
MGLNLLEKTELWVNHITLDHANLTLLAKTVADVLGLNPKKVLVVDVRPEHITLDIMENDIPAENIIGKEPEILDALSELPGVFLTEESFLHSNGVLGLICLEGQNPEKISETVNSMVDEMKERIAKRVMLFPTGFELKQRLIEDTNTPYLKKLFESLGYKVEVGDTIEDDVDDMRNKLSDAVSRAFGLIVTTGGVGAEDKDKTVEGILEIDPQAATSYIVKFRPGTGRHIKDGVRVAVGVVGPSMLVSFPGPHDEVQLAAGVLLECLKKRSTKEVTARKIATALAENLTKKGFHHEEHHEHLGSEIHYKKGE